MAFLLSVYIFALPSFLTLPDSLLSEVRLIGAGLWEWAGSQQWLEISSSNWISRGWGEFKWAV